MDPSGHVVTKRTIFFSCFFFFLRQFFFCLFLFDFREHGKEGEREGGKHQCERETSIGCLWQAPCNPGIALTRNQTGDLSVYGMMPNELSHAGQGSFLRYPLTGLKKRVLAHAV